MIKIFIHELPGVVCLWSSASLPLCMSVCMYNDFHWLTDSGEFCIIKMLQFSKCFLSQNALYVLA